MQAVILAAGEGTRMRPLTETRPKPLVEVAGMPLLTHIASALPEEITELVIVVGYRAEQIIAHCGDIYHDRPVTYVYQNGVKGTGGALLAARDVLKGRFLVVAGDDLMHPEGFHNALKHPRAVVAYRHFEPERFGVITMTPEGMLESIEEKPTNPQSDLVNTASMVLDTDIFKYSVSAAENGELQLTDMVVALARDEKVAVVQTPFWFSVGRPEDIPKAEEVLMAD